MAVHLTDGTANQAQLYPAPRWRSWSPRRREFSFGSQLESLVTPGMGGRFQTSAGGDGTGSSARNVLSEKVCDDQQEVAAWAGSTGLVSDAGRRPQD